VTNINACAAPGDAPFYGLCTLGFGRYTMRGYTQGRYRDHYGNVVQAELRGHRARFGAVVFGSFGQVAETAGDIFEAELLPAGGLGARYQLTAKYPMHLRLDYAWGVMAVRCISRSARPSGALQAAGSLP
jgi:hemolysin activation/secretion protein